MVGRSPLKQKKRKAVENKHYGKSMRLLVYFRCACVSVGDVGMWGCTAINWIEYWCRGVSNLSAVFWWRRRSNLWETTGGRERLIDSTTNAIWWFAFRLAARNVRASIDLFTSAEAALMHDLALLGGICRRLLSDRRISPPIRRFTSVPSIQQQDNGNVRTHTRLQSHSSGNRNWSGFLFLPSGEWAG